MAIIENEEHRSRGSVADAIFDWSICMHEAGHAVVAERCLIRVDCATVIPEKDTLGYVAFEHPRQPRLLELVGDHSINVAGFAAESLVCKVRKSEIWIERKFYHLESTDFKNVVAAVRDERGERQYNARPEGHGRGRNQPCCALPTRTRETRSDRVAAWEIWKERATGLRKRWREDPTCLRQILGVAKELSLRRELSGDEVREAMAAAAQAGAAQEAI